MDIASQLRSHPLFRTFTAEALAEAVREGTPITYQPGDSCIRQGEAGEIFGVLLNGKLEVVRDHDTPSRQRIGTVEPGECFGEMSLLTGNPSSADVVAVAESEAVVFLQEAIRPIIALNADAVSCLTRLITRRLTPAVSREAPPKPAAVRLSLGAHSPMRILTLSCSRNAMRFTHFDTTGE